MGWQSSPDTVEKGKDVPGAEFIGYKNIHNGWGGKKRLERESGRIY